MINRDLLPQGVYTFHYPCGNKEERDKFSSPFRTCGVCQLRSWKAKRGNKKKRTKP